MKTEKVQPRNRFSGLARLAAATILGLGLTLLLGGIAARAGDPFPMVLVDQTPTEPLPNPDPTAFQPRYISGFGSDDSFTVFFEDRDSGGAISFASTTTGPTGFGASPTATNIIDTHFLVKDWPVSYGGNDYAYRAWAGVGNNVDLHFYGSNNLTDWTLLSTFQLPLPAPPFLGGGVYYGFHDVILLNGTYYAFGESNLSETALVSSPTGTDDWTPLVSMGTPLLGPLQLPAGVVNGWTPTGSFFDLGHDRGTGKVYADPRDSAFYLAINTAAKTSLPPAQMEAAFINPANWTWHDGVAGPASTPIMTATVEHDLRECWMVPLTNPDDGWTLIYDADYGSTDGGKALGYAGMPAPPWPAITVTKKASLILAEVGQTITYTYRVTNSGNVILTSVSAADNRLGPITLDASILAPDAGTSGIATYTVQESDLPGPLTNTVTVTGSPPLEADVSATAVESVVVIPTPAPGPTDNPIYLPLVVIRWPRCLK